MATAKRTKVSVTQYKPGVSLTLTEGEADFLIGILAKVGGNPARSPRKYQQRISAALARTVGYGFRQTDSYRLARGNIWLDEYPKR